VAERKRGRHLRRALGGLPEFVLAGVFGIMPGAAAGQTVTEIALRLLRSPRASSAKEFEASLKQIMAAYKKAGIRWFLTLQNFAGDTTEYTTVVPVMKFADLDGPPVVVKVLGEQGWGRMDDYLTWLKNDCLPALEKAGVAHFFVSRPIFGGEGGEVVSSRMLKNLAEIDGGPILTKALGEAGAFAVNARSVPLVRSSTTRILLMRTDLTYSTAGPPAN
jgi:hypothetical protein